MGEYGASHGALDDEEHVSYVSIPYVILASILCGIGLFLTLAWVIMFYWPYFVGVPIATGGFLLFFSRYAGLDRSS